MNPRTQIVALLTVASLVFSSAQAVQAPLAELSTRPYLDLMNLATDASYSSAEYDQVRKHLANQQASETKRLQQEEKALDIKIKDLRDSLASLNKEASEDTPRMAERRNALHCDILRLEKERTDKRLEREKGMPVSFDNKRAKLKLVEQWPAQKREILSQIQQGKSRQRPYGDVQDIGVRKVGPDQGKDIKLGEEAVRDLKLFSLMPTEIEDAAIKAYMQALVDRIRRNSDVTVPVKLKLLRSEEINAFALPGGFL